MKKIKVDISTDWPKSRYREHCATLELMEEYEKNPPTKEQQERALAAMARYHKEMEAKERLGATDPNLSK